MAKVPSMRRRCGIELLWAGEHSASTVKQPQATSGIREKAHVSATYMGARFPVTAAVVAPNDDTQMSLWQHSE